MSARDLHSLNYLKGVGALILNATPEKLRSVLVALDSDLSPEGKSEVDRYNEVRGNDPAFLAALCVIGPGYRYQEGSASPRDRQTYEGSELV